MALMLVTSWRLPETIMIAASLDASAVALLNWPWGGGLMLCMRIQLPCMTGASRTTWGILGMGCMPTEFSRGAASGLLLRNAGASSGTAVFHLGTGGAAEGGCVGLAARGAVQGCRPLTMLTVSCAVLIIYVSGLRLRSWGVLGAFVEAARVALVWTRAHYWTLRARSAAPLTPRALSAPWYWLIAWGCTSSASVSAASS